MIKWFFILIRAIPSIILLLIEILFKYKRKDQIPYEVRYNRVKRTMHTIYKTTRGLIKVDGLNYMNDGHQRGRIYFSNHFTVYEAVMLFEMSDKPLHFLTKIENKKVFAVGLVCKYLDVLFVDRDSVMDSLRIFKHLGNEVKELNYDYVVFPEGTRSKTGKVNEFKAALLTTIHYSESDTVLMAMDARDGLKAKLFSYKYQPVYAKIFAPICYDDFLKVKDTFNESSRKMLQKAIDEFRSH